MFWYLVKCTELLLPCRYEGETNTKVGRSEMGITPVLDDVIGL